MRKTMQQFHPHTTQVLHQPVGIDPVLMEMSTLVRRCEIESERFHRREAYDTRFAHELFRRALVERSDLAWEYLYWHYHNLVETWVLRSSSFRHSGESSEFFVAAAFLRFWRAISPERFASFPTLGALLDYLRCCASCV